MKLKWLSVWLLGVGVGQALANEYNADAGKSGYQRCAVCHLPDGAGIPSAFPPIKDRLSALVAHPKGREYLVVVVNSGLMGSISVQGVPYMSAMPPQGTFYDAKGLSDVLNYVVLELNKAKIADDWTPYSATEVDQIIKKNPKANLSTTNKMRADLLKAHPDLEQ